MALNFLRRRVELISRLVRGHATFLYFLRDKMFLSTIIEHLRTSYIFSLENKKIAFEENFPRQGTTLFYYRNWKVLNSEVWTDPLSKQINCINIYMRCVLVLPTIARVDAQPSYYPVVISSENSHTWRFPAWHLLPELYIKFYALRLEWACIVMAESAAAWCDDKCVAPPPPKKGESSPACNLYTKKGRARARMTRQWYICMLTALHGLGKKSKICTPERRRSGEEALNFNRRGASCIAMQHRLGSHFLSDAESLFLCSKAAGGTAPHPTSLSLALFRSPSDMIASLLTEWLTDGVFVCLSTFLCGSILQTVCSPQSLSLYYLLCRRAGAVLHWTLASSARARWK